MSSSDLMEALIEHDSGKMDKELFQFQNDQTQGISLTSCASADDNSNGFLLTSNNFEDSILHSPQISSSNSLELEEDQTPPRLPKARRIISRAESFSRTEESRQVPSGPRRRRRERRRQGQSNNPYPTKNFLQNAKGRHFVFLERELGSEVVYSFSQVLAIKEKEGINMNDF